MIKNKKAIGFGRLLALMTLVLFGLMIWFFTTANNKIEASIGTDELNSIDPTNLEYYFSDSMRQDFQNSMKTLASSSFIDANVLDCRLTSDGINILSNDCKPNSDLIKLELEDRTANYIQESLKVYPINQEVEVSCNIEEIDLTNYIKCETSEIKLNSSRKNNFFSFSLDYRFNLNYSVRVDDFLRTTEFNEIYEKFKGCKENCKLSSEFWALDKTEVKGNYLIYTLSSKKMFSSDLKPLKWIFAIEKR
jgi:hypothetical protein